MTVDEWCEKNGITKANYYYRLNRVRQAFLESTLKSDSKTPAIVPVPITAPMVATTSISSSESATSDSLEITAK